MDFDYEYEESKLDGAIRRARRIDEYCHNDCHFDDMYICMVCGMRSHRSFVHKESWVTNRLCKYCAPTE